MDDDNSTVDKNSVWLFGSLVIVEQIFMVSDKQSCSRFGNFFCPFNCVKQGGGNCFDAINDKRLSGE